MSTRNVPGRPRSRDIGIIDYGILQTTTVVASCAGLVLPTPIYVVASPPALIPKNSLFPSPGACQFSNGLGFNPWIGDMVNFSPCSWRMPVPRNSWNGVRMGFGLPNATITFNVNKWEFKVLLVCIINPVNSLLQTWSKTTGSNPLGTYTADAGNCNAATTIIVAEALGTGYFVADRFNYNTLNGNWQNLFDVNQTRTGGYLQDLVNEPDSVSWTSSAMTAGIYYLRVGFAKNSDRGQVEIVIDGNVVFTVDTAADGSGTYNAFIDTVISIPTGGTHLVEIRGNGITTGTDYFKIVEYLEFSDSPKTVGVGYFLADRTNYDVLNGNWINVNDAGQTRTGGYLQNTVAEFDSVQWTSPAFTAGTYYMRVGFQGDGAIRGVVQVVIDGIVVFIVNTDLNAPTYNAIEDTAYPIYIPAGSHLIEIRWSGQGGSIRLVEYVEISDTPL